MSKEWLEEIRKLLVNLYNAVDVDEEMKHYIFNDLKIEWLIEQAERVQELEKENRELNMEIGTYSRKIYEIQHSIGANLTSLKLLSTQMLKGDSK